MIDIFIASVGIIPFNVVSSAAANIMSLATPFSTPDLSLSELATHVHTAVAEGTLTGEQAIAMVVRFAPSYTSDAIATANGVAAEVLALVDDGFISQADALAALTSRAGQRHLRRPHATSWPSPSRIPTPCRRPLSALRPWSTPRPRRS